MTSKMYPRLGKKLRPPLAEIMDVLAELESRVKALEAEDSGKLIDLINVLRSKTVSALKSTRPD